VAQYITFVGPTGLFSAAGAVMGMTVLRRRAEQGWVTGLAGAGAALGTVGFLLTVLGIVLALTVGDPAPQDF
jgi:hypothetical protein